MDFTAAPPGGWGLPKTVCNPKLGTMPNAIDLTGRRFGRWLVEGLDESDARKGSVWVCVCDCGVRRSVRSAGLRNGRSRSCGCLLKELAAARIPTISRKHGLSKHPLWGAWKRMRQRCTDENCTDYRLYGGRGIRVCRRWQSFENFLADMGERPTPTHSIDRIDTNGNYDPKNCRWATPTEQARNAPGNNVLTERDVIAIRRLRTKGLSPRRISIELDLPKRAVERVTSGETWKGVG